MSLMFPSCFFYVVAEVTQKKKSNKITLKRAAAVFCMCVRQFFKRKWIKIGLFRFTGCSFSTTKCVARNYYSENQYACWIFVYVQRCSKV